MDRRRVVLAIVLAFIGFLAFLTIRVIAQRGIDVLVVISIVVLAMFSFGIVGALRQPPED